MGINFKNLFYEALGIGVSFATIILFWQLIPTFFPGDQAASDFVVSNLIRDSYKILSGHSLVATDSNVWNVVMSKWLLTLKYGGLGGLLVFFFAGAGLHLSFQFEKFGHFFERASPYLLSLPSLVWIPMLSMSFGFPVYSIDPQRAIVVAAIALSIRPAFQIWVVQKQYCEKLLEENSSLFLRSLGLSSFQILQKSHRKSLMISFLAQVPNLLIRLLGGTFVIEVIFAIEGSSQLMISSLLHRDFEVLFAWVLLHAGLILVLQKISDFLANQMDTRRGDL